MTIAVVGAHLSGFPLNPQLTDRGGTLIGLARTAPFYRLFALANQTPPKPGLMRVSERLPHTIELELWDLSPAAFADFVSLVPPPMCIGTITLDDGEQVKGFLAEPVAFDGATDITESGGWRYYVARISNP